MSLTATTLPYQRLTPLLAFHLEQDLGEGEGEQEDDRHRQEQADRGQYHGPHQADEQPWDQRPGLRPDGGAAVHIGDRAAVEQQQRDLHHHQAGAGEREVLGERVVDRLDGAREVQREHPAAEVP